MLERDPNFVISDGWFVAVKPTATRQRTGRDLPIPVTDPVPATEIAVAFCLRGQGPSKQPVVAVLPIPINRWFVSFRPVGASWRARQTKGFATEAEAKRFAKAMLSKEHHVTAGTMTPHQPKRRKIEDWEIAQWIEGEK